MQNNSGLTGVLGSGSIPFQAFGVTTMEEDSLIRDLSGAGKAQKSFDEQIIRVHF